MADKDVAVIAGKEEVGDEATAAAALIADKEEVGDEATASATVNGPDKGTRRKVRVMVSVVHEVKAAAARGILRCHKARYGSRSRPSMRSSPRRRCIILQIPWNTTGSRKIMRCSVSCTAA